MKKTISAVLVCVLLACSILALTSCGKILIGTYKAETILGDVTYEFAIGGKVTRSIDPLIGKSSTVEGKYEFIQEDTKITLTFPDEDPVTYDFSSGTEDGVDYIKLDGVKYTKVK